MRFPMAESRVQHWINSVQARTSPDIPIIIVGTHLDDAFVERAGIPALRENLGLSFGKNVRLVTFVSCQTGMQGHFRNI